MKNAEWMIEHGMRFSNLKWAYINGKNVVYYEDYPNGIKAEPLYFEDGQPKDIVTKWLDMEHKEPILDDVEKRYLKGVIRPFRDRVKYIKKIEYAREEYIHIQLNGEWTILPHFRTGAMYKGMKTGKEYSLEELGL